jgi:hypothetical protein
VLKKVNSLLRVYQKKFRISSTNFTYHFIHTLGQINISYLSSSFFDHLFIPFKDKSYFNLSSSGLFFQNHCLYQLVDNFRQSFLLSTTYIDVFCTKSLPVDIFKEQLSNVVDKVSKDVAYLGFI